MAEINPVIVVSPVQGPTITTSTGPMGPGFTCAFLDGDYNLTLVRTSGPDLKVGVVRGPQGVAGETGPQGEIGETGPQGEPGPTGATGSQGPVGPQGEVGPAGETGPQGPIGPQGVAGQDGAAGPQGATGSTGPQGLTGPMGPTGPGYTAARLDDGVLVLVPTHGDEVTLGSVRGPQGLQGIQGVPGPQGETGPQGPAGEAPEGITEVASDLSPSLGGDLDTAGYQITAPAAMVLNPGGTPDTKYVRVDGRLRVGMDIATSVPAGLLLASDSTQAYGSLLSLRKFSDTQVANLEFRRAHGDATTQTPVTSGKSLGTLSFSGKKDDTGYITAATIRAKTTVDFGPNTYGAQIDFELPHAADSIGGNYLPLSVRHDGVVVVGTVSTTGRATLGGIAYPIAGEGTAGQIPVLQEDNSLAFETPVTSQGPTGPQGPAGQDGATGPQGPAGETGAQGPAGETGAQGPAGPQGPEGPMGPQGPAGDASGGMAELVSDLSPQLGGDLDVNGHRIVPATGSAVEIGGPTVISKDPVNLAAAFATSLGAAGSPGGLLVGGNNTYNDAGIIVQMARQGAGAAHLALRQSRGTLDAPATTQSADYLGRFEMQGYNGSGFIEGFRIEATARELWEGTTKNGATMTMSVGRKVFMQATSASTVPTEVQFNVPTYFISTLGLYGYGFQSNLLLLRHAGYTADATPLNLTTDHDGGTGSPPMTLAAGAAVSFDVDVVARKSTKDEWAAFTLRGFATAAADGTVSIRSVVKDTVFRSDTTWDATMVATATGMAVRVTGAAGKSVKWTAGVKLVYVE